MSSLLKVIFIFLILIPFVRAEQPATTQSPEAAQRDLGPEVAATPGEKLRFEDYFRHGTKSYQDKKFDEAIVNFEKALEFHPESPTVLTDLGLSYYQIKKKGLSIAMFRRALFIDPSQAVAEAGLKFVLSQLEVKEIPHQIEPYERFRSLVLNSISLNGIHVLSLLLLFSSGFIWLRYIGRRRKAFEQESAPPGLPVVGLILSLGFVGSFLITVLKTYDVTVPRATIVTEKVSAQIAPGENQSGLFELYEGFEVIIRNAANDWIQVSYPGGLTGWVKKESLIATSGKNAF